MVFFPFYEFIKMLNFVCIEKEEDSLFLIGTETKLHALLYVSLFKQSSYFYVSLFVFLMTKMIFC